MTNTKDAKQEKRLTRIIDCGDIKKDKQINFTINGQSRKDIFESLFGPLITGTTVYGKVVTIACIDATARDIVFNLLSKNLEPNTINKSDNENTEFNIDKQALLTFLEKVATNKNQVDKISDAALIAYATQTNQYGI